VEFVSYMSHERFLDEGRDYGALADALCIDLETVNIEQKTKMHTISN
jgi:hypothetical protein